MKIRILVLLLILVLSILCSCGHTHEFSSIYSTDESNHWHVCKCGEKGDLSEHTFGEGTVTVFPTTEREGIMTYTCSVCQYKKNETIEKLSPEHTHTFDHLCYDDTNHWRECICGEKSEIAAHTWDEGKITVHPTIDSVGEKIYTCTVCFLERTEELEQLDPDHTHSFVINGSDEIDHWLECVCGKKEQRSAHTWDGGVVTIPATEVETGITTYECTECRRKATKTNPSTRDNGLSFLQSTHYRITNKLAKTPLTIEAEIYVSPSVTGRAGAVFGNYYGIREDFLLEIYEGGVPRFYYSDAAGNIKDIKFTNIDVRTGDFVHIALTFDFENKAIIFYLNGEAAQVIPCEADLADDITRYQFVVGGDNRSNNGIFFKGEIRSVSAYSDVRTAEEIKRSYENGTNLYADDILVSYLLNENSGGKDIKDLTGNGYDIPKEWLDSNEVELDYTYSFAVVGDTQWLSKYTPEKMEGIYDWIIENKDDRKIAHVFGLGDITEDWNTPGKETEWIRAQQYIYKLNGIVPYSLVRGNHDESKYFNKYFATDAYISQFGGEFMNEGDVRNSYKLVTIGSTDYLFLTLDYGASDEILQWANEVVLAHPNHRVIVTTHGYHGFDGGHLNYDNTPSSGNITSASDVDTSVGDNGNRGYNNGQQIWEKFVSLHPNIFLVMSGHTPMEDVFVLQTEGVHGNVVNQLLIDPQWMDPQKGGVGMVCMLYFSEDGSQMEIEWICTDTGKYYKEMNQFGLDLTDSINTPSHDFKDSYNETYHYKACDCGYIYNEVAHVFDGGSLNSDGFMVYSCECGYKRIASATDDPVAKELQQLLESYYNGGAYFAGSIFYGDGKFWTTDAADYRLTEDYLTLHDLVLGRYGDLKLDLGWNCHEGVYSSANESAILGVAMFVQTAKADEVNVGGITKVSIEANGAQLIIKLWSGESVSSTTTVGLYATTTLVLQTGDVVGEIYTKVNANYLCEILPPEMTGYVREYDKIILDSRHSSLERTVYYSTITTWDGKSASTSLKGSGTAEDPFLIESGADLAYIRDVVNGAAAQVPNFSGKYFKMTQSIDLGGHDIYIGSYPGWANRKGFFGFFDGNHCTIRGLNSTNSLFGTIENGWLKNLSVYGKVNGNTTIGGIVGYVANGGVLDNLTSYVTVTGVNTLGGVVGNAENQASTVSNCVNYGTVNGSSWIIGGVVGSGGNIVTNCVNFGNVNCSANDCVGGIAGSTKNTGSISNCYNYGKITARGKAGGIVGQANKPIVNCINYGDVNGVWALGGILGYVKGEDSASISDCVNFGNVVGSSTGNGGVFGIHEGGADAKGVVIIRNCINNGTASGTWGVGGIAGDTPGKITDCVNNGTISAKGEVGGIVGKAYGEITGCVNNGHIIGAQAIIGGIVGNLHVTTHGKEIWTTNVNNGILEGPDAQQIIGKGYVYVEEAPVAPGPITVEEFESQPAMFGSPWVSNNTRMKIVVKISLKKGTVITFLGDTSVYCWGVMETTDKDNASAGAWKDSGWNTSWDDSSSNTYTTTYATGYLVLTVGKLNDSGKPGLELTQTELDNIHSMFKIEGMKASGDASDSVNNPWLDEDMVSINHRGWYQAPENTLSAYEESYNKGFKYVECDVQFTKDGVPVLLHDDTIDRTSNGSGSIGSLTYEQLLQYDFSYDDNDNVNDFSAYRGEKIPTFEEFIALCKRLGLHPYIEIKGSITEAEAALLVKIVSDADMLDQVSWLSFSGDALAKIVTCDPTARLVWVLTDTYDSKIASNNIPFAKANLMTGESEVVFDLYYTLVSQSIVDLLETNNIPLEVWTVNDINSIKNLHPYVSGVSSDMYNAKEILATE